MGNYGSALYGTDVYSGTTILTKIIETIETSESSTLLTIGITIFLLAGLLVGFFKQLKTKKLTRKSK